jgi:TonB family protein
MHSADIFPERRGLMRRAVFVITIFFLVALSACGQQPASAINYDGPGVTAPVLTPLTITVSRPSKCEQIDGLVKLNAVIDQIGTPRNVVVISSDNVALNDFAAQWVAEQRFKPGTVNGAPAAISVALRVGLHTCAAHAKQISELELSAHPFVFIRVNNKPEAQQAGVEPTPNVKTAVIGGRVSAPIPTLVKDAEYPNEMKSKRRHGVCLLSVLVDATGLPRDVRVVKSLEPSMDRSAIDAVNGWRFQPALEDGIKPVPVVVTVSVGYGYREKQYFSVADYLPLAPDLVAHLKPSEFGQLFSAPELLNGDEVRVRYMPRSRVPGDCLIAAVIGTNGIPIDVRAANNLDSSLGLGLIDAVQHMRFKPAVKDGTPVPIGFVIAFKYSQKDMLREHDGSMPWWLDTVAEGAILAWML